MKLFHKHKTMRFKRENDNLYPVGTVVTTKENPTRKLVIMKYIHRTYYCAVVGDAAINHLTFHERDLLAGSDEGNPNL